MKIFWLKPHPDFLEFGAGLPSNVKVFSQSGWEIRILDLQQVGVGTILVAKKATVRRINEENRLNN